MNQVTNLVVRSVAVVAAWTVLLASGLGANYVLNFAIDAGLVEGASAKVVRYLLGLYPVVAALGITVISLAELYSLAITSIRSSLGDDDVESRGSQTLPE